MMLRWMEKRGCEPKDMTRLGMATLLAALFLMTVGTQMNRAYDRGVDSFAGLPLNEGVCVAVLIVGSVLMGVSIVFNVTGLRASRRRD